jgi:copper(I)-binding protein
MWRGFGSGHRGAHLSLAVALLSVVLAAGCFARSQPVLQSGTQGTNDQIGEILIRNMYVVPPAGDIYRPGESAVARFELYNRSNRPEALGSVASSAATEVRIRWDRDCDGDAEVVSRLPILPEGTVPAVPEAREGSTPYHLEIVGLTEVVRPGTTFPVDLTFERAGGITVNALVQVPEGYAPPPPPCPGAAGTG